MAEPKLTVEERLDKVELAISRMADFLVGAPQFASKNVDDFKTFLKGEDIGKKPNTQV